MPTKYAYIWVTEFLLFRTLVTPEMMMVLFLTGDLSFCFADSWSCLMAASATGSVPFNTNNSAGKPVKKNVKMLNVINTNVAF